MLYVILAFILIWLTYITFLLVKIRKNKNNAELVNNSGFRAGLIKFNPFETVGSNQSFCMALLMDDKSGIILTSLHGRNGTRVYARQVNLGNEAREKLSTEEKEAVKKALTVSNLKDEK